MLARGIARLPDRGAWLNDTAARGVLPPEAMTALEEGGFALDVMVDMLSEMRRLDTVGDLSRTTCPVWLVSGRWDHFRLDERAYRRARPDAHVVVVPGATHLVTLVRPTAVNRIVLEAAAAADAHVRDEGVQALGAADLGQGDPGGA